MAVFLISRSTGYAQFITVLVIFVLVLAATAFTTKWIADYQKQQGGAGNIELIEAMSLGNNKYVQIVRVGETYMALAVCKDSVTMLGEVPADQLTGKQPMTKMTFKEMLEKASGKGPKDPTEPKE